MNSQNELKHYGVLGMKWGVRKARNTLTSPNSSTEAKQKAVNSLNKHKNKINNKLVSLNNKGAKLQKQRDAQIKKADIKAAKYRAKAAKYAQKKYKHANPLIRTSISDALYQNSARKQDKFEAKAMKLESKIQMTKAKIEKNERYEALFNQGLKEVDSLLIEKGKKYINA